MKKTVKEFQQNALPAGGLSSINDTTYPQVSTGVTLDHKTKRSS